MPDLNAILNRVPELSDTNNQQKQEILNTVYEGLKASGKVRPEKLREFRNDQTSAFLAGDKAENPDKPEAISSGGGFLGGSVSQYLPKDRETYAKLMRRNALDDLRDVGRVAADPTQITAAFKKFSQDLIGLGLAAWASSGGMEAAGLRLVNKDTGESYTPSFVESLDKFNQIDSVKETNKWYEEVIKDDPELAKRYHAVLVDAAVGSIFGIARMAKAGRALAESGATKAGLTKLREFFAPVVSNVLGGQVIYSGIEGLDKALSTTDFPEETKTGIRLMATLSAGLISGIGPERWLENVITNNSKAVNVATQVGQLAKEAEKSGISFKDALAQHPELSDEARQILGIDTNAESIGQNLNPTIIQNKANEITETTDRLASGSELSIEEAANAKVLNPEIPLSPIKPEEIAENLGTLSSQAPKTSLDETLARLDEEELARIDSEALEASQDTTRGGEALRIEDSRQYFDMPQNGPQMAPESTKIFAGDNITGIPVSANTAPNAPQNSAFPRTYSPTNRRAVETEGQNLNQSSKKPELSWDSISLSRKALESLDLLTSEARVVQASIKQAVENGDNTIIEQLTKRQKDLKAKVEDTRKLIALEMRGSRELVQIVNKEIKNIDSQLKNMRNEWRETELATRKAELENRAIALKEYQQKLKDRKIVFQRIPAKASSEYLQQIKNERLNAIFTRGKEISKPFTEKIQRADAETRLNQLPETEKIRALKVSQAAQLGMEDILSRPLTDIERLDVLANVLNKERSWSDNPFTPSNTPIVQSQTREPFVLAGYIGERYPLVGRVLGVLHPQAVDTGVYTPDQVLQLAQALVARSGFGMDEQGWILQHDMLEQSFQLWDDVRVALPKSEGNTLKEFLESAMPNSKPATITKVADTINKAFPELDLTFRMDVLPKGVKATADSLSKLVTVGLGKVELKELMHEIGHLNFWHGMDSQTRLTWMDNMRIRANDEVSWANAFPEYAERMAKNTELDEVARANSEFWLHNPSEMYAQQFSAYTLANVIPTVETLGTFQKAWRGLKRTLGASIDNWETLPQDTKHMMIKTLTSPEPTEARLIPTKDIEEGLKTNWLYSDKETSEARALEIRQKIDSVYGQRMESIPESETLISDITQETPQVNFFDLPVEKRVASYALEDLPEVAEMHAISLLHDIPGADWQELQLILKRLHSNLSGENRAKLLDGIVISRQKISSPYDKEFDPTTGQYYSRQEILEEKMMSAISEYNRLSSASKNAIAKDNARKYKIEWFKRKEAASQVLREEKEAGRITSYTEKDIDALADRIWDDRAGNFIEGRAIGLYRENQEVADTTDQLYTQAEKQLAALDVSTDNLVDFTKYVLASKGMVQPIDPSFTQRLSKAELYADIASGKSGWNWPELAWKSAIQTAYIGLTGLEYDPYGTYIPFLGTVRWNPETFFETAPLGVFLLPGGWRGAKWAANKANTLTKPYINKVIGKLSLSTKLKLSHINQTLTKAFKASGGLSSDLIQAMRNAQIYSQSKKQDFYAFAETMHRHFTPEEREIIASIYEQRKGMDEIILDVAENRPDILVAIEMTRKLYSEIPKNFKELGLWSKNFEDLGDHYINRFYDGIGKKPTSAIFLNYNIAPIRGNFLKRRGIEAVIKNGKSSEQGASSIDALTRLRENAQESGIELREGLKVNSWEAQDGTILYSIPGTAYDDSLRAQKVVPLHQWDSTGDGYIITEVRKNSYKVRRDYTVKEREGMGEVVDVAVRSAAMGEQLERDLRQGRAFFNLANSKYAKRIENPEEEAALIEQGWKLVEDTIDKQTGLKKFGALSGMYIHPDAMIALNSISGRNTFSELLKEKGWGGALKVHQKLLSTWKVSKTVLSPVAHMNNFVSNMFMGYLMGHNPVSDLTTGLRMSTIRNMEIRAKNLVKEGKLIEAHALTEKMKQHEYYSFFTEMRNARMSDSSLWATELNSQSLLEELKKTTPSDTSELGTIQRYIGAGTKVIGDLAHKGVKFAGGWYEKGDLIYKMGAFVNARLSGKTADDAVKYAYEAYFDYGNLSPVARMLRDSGLVPFISYMYNALPALGKSLTQHPERVASVALMLEGLHLASIGAVYGSDETIAKREAIDTATPNYMQKRGLGGLFRTRILNPFGSDPEIPTANGTIAKHQFLDLTRMIPGGDLFETGAGISNIDFSLITPGELLYTFINQNPITSYAATVATGKNPQLGYSINDGGNIDTKATKERKEIKAAELLWNTIVPNLPFIPGTPTNKAIGEALAGNEYIASYGNSTGLDSMGMPKSLGVAVAGTFGVKFRDIYPEFSLARQIKYENTQLKQEKTRLLKLFKDARYTDEYKEQELEKFEQSVKEVEERQTKRLNMFDRLSDIRRTAPGGKTLVH